MKILKKRICIFSIVLCCSLFYFYNAKAQNIIITGSIFDKNTGESLAFATVFSQKYKKGTSTNKKGYFSLKLSDINDSLEISYIGYENENVAVSDLEKFSDNEFFLIPKEFFLDEITVNPVYPTELLEIALSYIPLNYPDFEMYFEAYFNEIITEEDSIIQYIEGILEIEKKSYIDSEKDNIKFTQGKICNNVKSSKLWDYMYFINAPYELLYSDIAKNPDDFLQVPDNIIHFLDNKNFEQYIYNYVETSDENLIGIKFVPNLETKKGVYKGNILIDRESKAFVKIEFEYSPERLEKVYYTESQLEIRLRQLGIYIPDNYYKSIVEYTKYNNKWILENVSNEYGFMFQIGKSENLQIKVKDNLIISKIEVNNKKIGYFHQLAKNINIKELIPKTDSMFWSNYEYPNIK